MAINWEEVQKALVPLKDYDDTCRRLRTRWTIHLSPKPITIACQP